MTPRNISFSGGRSSALMTKMLVDAGLSEHDHILFANTGKECEETLEFVRDCETHWGIKITWLEYDADTGFRFADFATASRKGEPFERLIGKRKFVPNVVTRFCTQELKIRPMKKYLQSLGYKYWNVLMGIRYDEPLRWGRMIKNDQKDPWFCELPLYEAGIVKADVMRFWAAQPFDLRLRQDEGNCDLCFMKRKYKLIKLMRAHPEKAQWWIEQEKKTGGGLFQRVLLLGTPARSPDANAVRLHRRY